MATEPSKSPSSPILDLGHCHPCWSWYDLCSAWWDSYQGALPGALKTQELQWNSSKLLRPSYGCSRIWRLSDDVNTSCHHTWFRISESKLPSPPDSYFFKDSWNLAAEAVLLGTIWGYQIAYCYSLGRIHLRPSSIQLRDDELLSYSWS